MTSLNFSGNSLVLSQGPIWPKSVATVKKVGQMMRGFIEQFEIKGLLGQTPQAQTKLVYQSAVAPRQSSVAASHSPHSQPLRPRALAARPRSAPPLRVHRVLESDHTRQTTGRMVISGRMADVCAELDRLAGRSMATH